MPRKLPGISHMDSALFFRALQERALLSQIQRRRGKIPEGLMGQWPAQWWWAFFTELQDRPLWTLLGLLAAVSYPLFWGLHHFR